MARSPLLSIATLGLATLTASLRAGGQALLRPAGIPARAYAQLAAPKGKEPSDPITRDALAVRVRDAILDEEERPYVIWNEEGPRPLKINLDLLNYRAKQLERRQDLDGAVKTLEHCCSIDPNDGRAWIALARLRERAGSLDESEALLKEGLRWEPASCYLLQAYGALQERRGMGDEALDLYAAALRANPRHAPAWVACGLLLERRRQLDAAATCLLMAKSVSPRSYYVWQVIGEWHKRRGELSSAREAYRRSLSCNPRNAATFHAWGVLEWRCSHQGLAAQLFKKGLEVSPRNRYILQSWACMEARSGRSDEAARLFAKATSKKRKNRPDGATWQAKALHAKAAGKLDEARQCIEAGVACDPRHIPLYHAWGQLEIGENNVTAARDIYQRGVWASKNERDTASLWTAWALLEERAGDYEQARSYLREALRRDQWAVDVRLTWALLEARAGAYVPARQLFEGAVRIDPTNADVWYAYEEMERAYGTAAAAEKQSLPVPVAKDDDTAPVAVMKIGKCFSEAGVQIVAQPYLVEEELEALSQKSSEDWIRWLGSEKLIKPDCKPVSVEILNGGRYYFSQAAWNAVHKDQPCGVLKLRARRGHASAETYGGAAHNDKNLEPGMELYQSPGSDWCVRLWDIPQDLTFTGPVLVGDTIATGTTLVGVLGWLVEKMVAAKTVQDVHVFTIVGASEWNAGDGGVVEKLKHVDEALKKHGKQLTVTFCNATFGLDANGTDLNPCPDKGADWIPEALESTKKRVGSSFPLAKMKCGVWDWGDRFTKPLHHLEEVLEHYEAMPDSPDYILKGLRERIVARRKNPIPLGNPRGGAASSAEESPTKRAKTGMRRNESKTGMHTADK